MRYRIAYRLYYLDEVGTGESGLTHYIGAAIDAMQTLKRSRHSSADYWLVPA